MAYETLTGKKPVTQKQVAAAAQELRTLLHDLTLQAETGQANYEEVRYDSGGDPDPSGMYDENGDEIDFTYNPEWMQGDVKARIDYWAMNLIAKVDRLKSEKDNLAQAIKNRKTVAGLAELDRVWATVVKIGFDLASLRDSYRFVETKPAYLNKGTLSPERLRHAYELSQCMPTAEDIPTTPAENTLRAICALLRNHQVPGSETLTQAVHGEEVDHGANKEGALEEIVSDLSPTGAVVVTGNGAGASV